MISTLHIKNIGIIEDITIDFNKGLNVLTGETGAGKTLIVDSLGIIAGGRFSKEMIRRGEKMSYIEVCLYMPESEFAVDGNIIVSREINTSGKNLCKINGRMITVNELRNFMKKIIDIHGQFDNQTLMDEEFHTKYLDKFIGENISKYLTEYDELYNEYKELKKKLQENLGDDRERQRKLDLLQYQYNEIKDAKLTTKEEEELEEKKKVMLNSQKISTALETVNGNLSNTAIEVINSSIKALEKIESIDEKYEQKLIELKNIYYEVQELARDVADMNDEMSFSDMQIDEVEERLEIIKTLKRKYGNSIEEILNYKEEIKKEINRINNLDEENEILKEEITKIENRMKNLCNQIKDQRVKNSVILNEKINSELTDLEMNNARFFAKVIDDVDFTKNGKCHVEFLISTNIGEEAHRLDQIASGGEMSRIMLAIKNVLSDVDEVPVLIFDEIDTGISGKAANSVAIKLGKIAKRHQVLIITHLAPIAAKGDYNYYIYKKVENDKTFTNIKLLNEQEVIEEIARISSGEATKTALLHAKELREKKIA